jgi:hypothetical protein
MGTLLVASTRPVIIRHHNSVIIGNSAREEAIIGCGHPKETRY